eukprot:1832424-Amphidinium_carterae.1
MQRTCLQPGTFRLMGGQKSTPRIQDTGTTGNACLSCRESMPSAEMPSNHAWTQAYILKGES